MTDLDSSIATQVTCHLSDDTQMSSIMEIDESFRYSLSRKYHSSKRTSGNARYAEVATSSEPYPVARLLDQIKVLQSELDQERQWRTDERTELEERHQADVKRLEKIKDDAEEEVVQSQERHTADLGRLLKEVLEMDDKWTALKAQASSLGSEVDRLRALNVDTDGSTQTEAKISPFAQGVAESEAWQEEKSKLLTRQTTLERTVSALQDEAKVCNAFIRQLQEQHNVQRPLNQERDLEIADLQVRNTTYSKLLKELASGYEGLSGFVRQQTELLQEAGDIIERRPRLYTDMCSGVQGLTNGHELIIANNPPSISKSTGIDAMLSAEPTLQSPRNSIEAGKAPADSAITAASRDFKGQKRDLSALLDGERDGAFTQPQKRRIDSQSSTPISSQSQQGDTSGSAGDKNPQKDFSMDWRARSKSKCNDRSERANYEIERANYRVERANYRSERANYGLERAFEAGPVTVIDEGVRFKNPTPKRKKWQNSVLKKKR